MKQNFKSRYPKLLNYYYIIRFYCRFFYRKQVRHHIFWKISKGDKKLYKNLPLNCESIFFDVGAHIGMVSEKINHLYGCKIYSFEPDYKNYNYLVQKFKSINNIAIYNFALSNFDGLGNMITNHGSASFKLVPSKIINNESVQVKNISKFLIENKINKIDVLKLNVEGSEFEILENLLDNKYIENVNTLLVQFHENYDNAHLRRLEIIERLKKTHTLIFNYYFVWEKWVRK